MEKFFTGGVALMEVDYWRKEEEIFSQLFPLNKKDYTFLFNGSLKKMLEKIILFQARLDYEITEAYVFQASGLEKLILRKKKKDSLNNTIIIQRESGGDNNKFKLQMIVSGWGE